MPGQPPLRWWSQAWRLAFAVALGLGEWLNSYASNQWQHERWLFWTDLAVGAVAVAAVLLRRRHPYLAVGIACLASMVSASALGAIVVIGVSLATRRRWPEIVVFGLLGLAAGQVLPYVNPGDDGRDAWLVTLSSTVAFVAVTLVTGLYIGSRRELLFTLRDRAERAERERDLQIQQAKTLERRRIAREMHDVLAHRLSLISMHAGAQSLRRDLGDDGVRESVRVIEESAHLALAELRDVLGVLRDDVDHDLRRPQPTAAQLPELLDEARRGGSNVTARLDVDLNGLTDACGRAVYRLVQEGLTNARKHAPRSAVEVSVHGTPDDGVVVSVRNPLSVSRSPSPPTGARLGLVGLRERVELHGGRLLTASDDDEFLLEAWLPWPA